MNKNAGYRSFYRKRLNLSLVEDISFSNFVHAINERDAYNLDKHWSPQFLQSGSAFFNLDYVGKLEHLEASADHIKKIVKHDFKFELHAPHATGSTKKIKEYYSPELAEIVSKKFAKDFSLFEYESEPDWLQELRSEG